MHGQLANDSVAISTNTSGDKSGGRVRNAVELTSGGPQHAHRNCDLRMERSILTVHRESPEGHSRPDRVEGPNS